MSSYAITSDENINTEQDDGIMIYSNLFNPFENRDKFITKITIGNIEVRNTKQFNWLQKLMIKIFFGFIVEDCKEKEDDNN